MKVCKVPPAPGVRIKGLLQFLDPLGVFGCPLEFQVRIMSGCLMTERYVLA